MFLCPGNGYYLNFFGLERQFLLCISSPGLPHSIPQPFNAAHLRSSLPLSCLDRSDYQESSRSGSAEDEYLPIRQRSPKVGMTRLDPPPHRPNPRAWMEEARSRDGFSGRAGTQKLTLCLFVISPMKPL